MVNVDSGIKYSSEVTEWLNDDKIGRLSLCAITEGYRLYQCWHARILYFMVVVLFNDSTVS